MLHRILARSRYLMLIAVFGSFAASVTLLIYGALETVITISHTATVPGFPPKLETTDSVLHRSCRFVSPRHSILHDCTRTLRAVY